MGRGRARKARRRRKRLPAKVRVTARRRSGKGGRRRRRAVNPTPTLIITRRKRRRRRRRAPKASRKAVPLCPAKPKTLTTGGKGERGPLLFLPPPQGEQPRPCGQHPLHPGLAEPETRRHHHQDASSDLRLTSRSKRGS